MNRFPAFLLLALILSLNASAQSGHTVTGRVVDSSGAGLRGSTLKLYPPTGKDTMRMVTGEDGFFRFNRVPFNDFILTITNMGYETWTHAYHREPGQPPLEIGAIGLREQATTLQEVFISTPAVQDRKSVV